MTIHTSTCPFCGQTHELVDSAKWGKAGKEIHITGMCIPCQLANFLVWGDPDQDVSLEHLARGERCGWRFTVNHDEALLHGLRKAADRWERECHADPVRENYQYLARLCGYIVTVEDRMGRKDDPKYYEMLDWAIRSAQYCKE